MGSALRYAMSVWITASTPGSTFPWATLAVNVVGSFIIGLVMALGEQEGTWWALPGTKAFIIVGILGGFTTFSSFSLQTFALLQGGHALQAALNVFFSVGTCLLATCAGFTLVGLLSQKT